MKRRGWVAAILCGAAVAAVGAGAYWLGRGAAPGAQRPVFDPAGLLGGAAEGYARVAGDWRFRFPDDHLAHPDFRAELWTFTAHLSAPGGQRFGVQLVMLRAALAPGMPRSDSAWATHQVYRGQLSLTDAGAARFHAFERYSRAALGLSGTSPNPPRLWIEDWAVEMGEENGSPRFRIKAGEGEVAVDVALVAAKPPLLGAKELWGEGTPPFYAYAITRLTAQGVVSVAGKPYTVTGVAWFDHAWGEVPVGQGQTALNRFALQFDDGSELIALQLHRRGGGGRPVVFGLRIAPDNTPRRYGQGEISLGEDATWRSAIDQAIYPARWTIAIPAEDWRADIAPAVADQEIDLTARYWSGTVRARALTKGQASQGNGFVDLTGYEAVSP